MVSCFLTKVLLNVSAVLTIQCFQSDGTIYNRTISISPLNLTKIQSLSDNLKENNSFVSNDTFMSNMSYENLKDSSIKDKLPSNNNITHRSETNNIQNMTQENYTKLVTFLTDNYISNDKIQNLNETLKDFLNVSDILIENKVTYIDTNNDNLRTLEKESNIESDNSPSVAFTEKVNYINDFINKSNVEYDSTRTAIRIIDKEHDYMVKTMKTRDEEDGELGEFSNKTEISETHINNNNEENEIITKESINEVNRNLDESHTESNRESNSEFNKQSNIIQNEINEHNNAIQTEPNDNILTEIESTLKSSSGEIAQHGSDMSLQDINNEFRTENSLIYSKENDVEIHNETMSKLQKIEYLHKCMSKSYGLLKESLVDSNNDLANKIDEQFSHVFTKSKDVANRIEKRSIPHTDSNVHEYNLKFTKNQNISIERGTKFVANKNIASIDEHSSHHTRSKENNNFNFGFPGPDNFWDAFVTSPVEIILNSTFNYDNEDFDKNMSDTKKAYYDNLVRKLKEQYKTETNTLNEQGKHTSCDGETYKANDDHLKIENNESLEQKDKNISDEVSHIIKDIDNPGSLEKVVAKNLLKQMTQKPIEFLNLEKRLGPEKYSEYVKLKQFMDSQYKDVKEHLNRTDNRLRELFYEMRALKQDKHLEDYFQENMQQFTHLTTPKNYSDTIYYIDGDRSTCPDPWAKVGRNTSYHESDIIEDFTESESERKSNYDILEGSRPFDKMRDKGIPNIDDENSKSEESIIETKTETVNINERIKYSMKTPSTPSYNHESLERFDKQRYYAILSRENKVSAITIIPNVGQFEIDKVHDAVMKKINETTFERIKEETQKTHGISTNKIRSPENKITHKEKIKTQTRKPWFDESLFDKNDPKIQYAKYLHNVRNMSVKLNMEVGKKSIKNISFFDSENLRYAHQYKQTTEHRRFSHMIPFWLTQPKEIEDIFKGNTKIFREYIQYVLDKHNFTELPVHGRFAFLRRFINRLNNPLIFNRITIFPTPFTTTDHARTFREQIKHFKTNLKCKIHSAYKHIKHFLFNSSLAEEGNNQVHADENTDILPEEIVINITTPIPAYYNYYDNNY